VSSLNYKIGGLASLDNPSDGTKRDEKV